MAEEPQRTVFGPVKSQIRPPPPPYTHTYTPVRCSTRFLQNLREAVSMTGLYPGRALLGQFASGGKKNVDLSAFLAVILENLEYEKDMMDDLVTLFEMFDEDGSGTISAKSLRHLLMEVLTSDQTELSRAEFDEFLEYAGLDGGEIIDYKALANNFMLSKPERKMVVDR